MSAVSPVLTRRAKAGKPRQSGTGTIQIIHEGVACAECGTLIAITGPGYFGSGVNVLASVAVLTSLGAAGYGILQLYRQDVGHAFPALAAAGALMAVGTFASALPTLDKLYVSERLAKATACHDRPTNLSGYSEPSAVFRMGTAINMTLRNEALAALATRENAIAGISLNTPETDQTGNGLNYSKDRPVTLQLYVAPGVPADTQLCAEETR